MKDLEESFKKLEYCNRKNEELKNLIELMLQECFVFTAESLEHIELVEKYKIAQTMTNAIFDLLRYQIKENEDYIKSVNEEAKPIKVGELKKEEQKQKIQAMPFYNKKRHKFQSFSNYDDIKIIDEKIEDNEF